jgi:hypothetical protein
MVLIADEDGDRHTTLPQYFVTMGYPGQALGGECMWITGRETYYAAAGLYFVNNGVRGDATGDGVAFQFAIQFFCPDDTGGGGKFIVEPTSKFAKGEYDWPGGTRMPFAMTVSYRYFYDAAGLAGGVVCAPGNNLESYHHDDLDGDLVIRTSNQGAGGVSYFFDFNVPDFEFVPGTLRWVSTGDVQPGGTVMGTFTLLNTGAHNIKLKEDKGIENDKGFKLQGLNVKDRIGPDGVLEPQETAVFFFALTVSAGSPVGPLDITLYVTFKDITKQATVTLPIILKMFGEDQSCYRHRQNALRTLRAFDMDDDEGMLHNLEPGDLVILDDKDNPVAPEEALLLLISFYEGGCRSSGHNDVEHAHSASSSLTGHYGMGMQYWGFAPGQEEGNEGNGNGGLSGQERKDVYGF